MPIIKSFSPNLNLQNFKVFINDTAENSFYFRISEFKDVFTGGKNGFLIEGTKYLKESTELKIEIKDVEDVPVFHEPGEGIPQYYEGTSKLVSVHVYEDTPIGEARIIVLGELKTHIDQNGDEVEVPDEWKGVYNVKWEKVFKINKNLPNEDKVRFYRRPTVDIEELSGSLFSRTFITETVTPSLQGIPIQPEEGVSLNQFPAGTVYKLKSTTDLPSNLTTRNSFVTVSGIGIQNQPITSIVNNREFTITDPFVVNGRVSSFQVTGSSITYETIDSSIESSILASFAEFDFDNLRTFVGDVARLKVLSKPALSITDFEIIDDIRLESSEFLEVIENGSVIPIGVFTSNFETYWEVSGDNTVEQTNENVFGGLGIFGQAATPTQIKTKNTFNLKKDGEYTLAFDVKITGGVQANQLGEIYLEYTRETGSVLRVPIVKFVPTAQLSVPQRITQNVKITETGDYTLVFEFSGSRWDFGKVSFSASQETSFSPDDLKFTIPFERTLEKETFDFKFEFFDINNNYIPVDVFATKTFEKGNVQVLDKFLRTDFIPKPFFDFDTDDKPTPENQEIEIRLSKNKIVGDILITSQSFDLDGNLMDPLTYDNGTTYPGELTIESVGIGEEIYKLSIANFTGSLHEEVITETNKDKIVSSIQYTLQENQTQTILPVNTTFVIYRRDVGDSAKELKVTSDKNQFTYKRTDLRPNPPNQEIEIEVFKSSLPTTNGLSITQVGSGPVLTPQSPPSQLETYTLTAGNSTGQYNPLMGSTRYTFSVEDNRGVPFSGSIKIDPVVVDDAVNVKLTKDTHTFNADSTGILTDAVNTGNVTVSVSVGGDVINYNDSFTPNTWRIKPNSYQITGGTALALATTSTTATVGITDFTNRTTKSAVITFTVEYKDGRGVIEEIDRSINYSKALQSSPLITPFIFPRSQVVNSFSTGVQVDSLSNIQVQVQEIYEGQVKFLNIGTLTATSPDISNIVTTGIGTTVGGITLNGRTLPNNINNTTVTITIGVVDDEGESRTLTDQVTISKSKNAPPTIDITVTPESQTVAGEPDGTQIGSLQNIVVIATEGGVNRFTSISGVSQTGFDETPTVSTNQIILTNRTLPPNLDSGTLSFNVNFVDSEGTSGSRSFTVTASKSKQGIQGIQGITGPGVVFRGPHISGKTDYQFQLTFPGRRDAVISSNRYYATRRSPQTGAPTGTASNNADWEHLGVDSFFLAAEIILSRNSFVQSTLNIGTNTAGNTANITLFGGGASPYLSIGQSPAGVYNANGIFLGRSDGQPRFSLKSGNNGLFWDGSALTVTGAISGGTISIGNNFTVDNSGNLAATNANITGTINATLGTIGGWGITTNSLTGGGGSTTIGLIPGTGIHLGNANFGSSPFRVTNAGELTATNANISGTITATSGTIGGWTIAPGKITGGSTELAAAGTITTTALQASGGLIGGFLIDSNRLSRTTSNTRLVFGNRIDTDSLRDRPGVYAGFFGNGTTPAISVRSGVDGANGVTIVARPPNATGAGNFYIRVRSNNEDLFNVNPTGLTVKGTINATSGNISGQLTMGPSGAITNSGNDFTIDSDGFLLNVASGSTFQSPRGVKWVDGATDRLRVWSSASQAYVEGVNNTELFVRSNNSVFINSGSSNDIRIGGVGRHILMLTGNKLAPINTAQMNAISSPLNGIMYWNITVNRPVFYDGTQWRQVRSSSV